MRSGIVTDAGALYRLLAWLSPGYPVGAYTYSHGLEQAIEAGYIDDAVSVREWIGDIVTFGGGFSDTVFLAEAYRATTRRDKLRLKEVAEVASVFVASKELALETRAQGAAFLEITERAWKTPEFDLLRSVWSGAVAYPFAVGCAAAGHGIALVDVAHGYQHAFAANLISAAVRLVPLGQTDGQRTLAALEKDVEESVKRAMATDIENVSSAALMVDICSMKHETQHTRLFRS